MSCAQVRMPSCRIIFSAHYFSLHSLEMQAGSVNSVLRCRSAFPFHTQELIPLSASVAAGTTKLLGLLGEIADTRGKSMAQAAWPILKNPDFLIARSASCQRPPPGLILPRVSVWGAT